MFARRQFLVLGLIATISCAGQVPAPYTPPQDSGRSCPAGEVSCDETGFAVKICADDNLTFSLVPCADGQFCRDGTYQDQVCEPDQNLCVGRAVAQCDALGSGYVENAGTNCEAAGLWCRDGACVQELCEPACTEDEYCAPEGRCHDKVCEPGARVCTGNVAELCDDLGAEVIESDDCDEGGRVCRDGRCAPIDCGDGIVDEGETCDDGNDVDVDECTNACQPARSGDGIVQTGVEQCDDGNDDEGDACTPDGFRMGQLEYTAGRDCAAIKPALPESTDGVYWIRPDGEGPLQARCDMTTDRGGWTKIVGQDVPNAFCGESCQRQGLQTQCGPWQLGFDGYTQFVPEVVECSAQRVRVQHRYRNAEGVVLRLVFDLGHVIN